VKEDGGLIVGKVGIDLTVDEAKLAAQQVGLAMLCHVKIEPGKL